MPQRRWSDGIMAVAGLMTAIGVSEGATHLLKLFIQRRRPNFYALCNFSPVTMLCTAPLSHIREAHFSFPSGHSSLASTSTTYMTWYFCGKLAAVAPPTSSSNPTLSSPKIRRVLLSLLTCCMLPGWSMFVAATRLVDHWHHPSDVVAGLVLGSVVGTITFHTYYYPLQQHQLQQEKQSATAA